MRITDAYHDDGKRRGCCRLFQKRDDLLFRGDRGASGSTAQSWAAARLDRRSRGRSCRRPACRADIRSTVHEPPFACCGAGQAGRTLSSTAGPRPAPRARPLLTTRSVAVSHARQSARALERNVLASPGGHEHHTRDIKRRGWLLGRGIGDGRENRCHRSGLDPPSRPPRTPRPSRRSRGRSSRAWRGAH